VKRLIEHRSPQRGYRHLSARPLANELWVKALCLEGDLGTCCASTRLRSALKIVTQPLNSDSQRYRAYSSR
jgi:hypothetical protein